MTDHDDLERRYQRLQANRVTVSKYAVFELLRDYREALLLAEEQRTAPQD